MHRVLSLLLVGCLLLATSRVLASPAASVPAPAASGNLKVATLYLRGGSRPRVNYSTAGQFARSLIPLYGLMANSRQFGELDARLGTTLAGYDRESVLHDKVAAAFAKWSPMFVLERGSFDYEDFGYGASWKAKAFPQGYDYVLVLNEPFAGLAMTSQFASRDGKVAPLALVEAFLYDGRTRKQLLSGKFSAYGLEARPLEDALADREFFVKTYPNIAQVVTNQLVVQMNRDDLPHRMAAAIGRGDEVPAIGSLLRRYAKRFRLKADPTSDWTSRKMGSDYDLLLEPRDWRNQLFGIRLEVDLLVPEFDQDVDTVEAYVEKVRGRLASQGVEPDSMVPFDELTLPPGFRVYSIVTDAEHDGRVIMAVRKLDDDMVEKIRVIFPSDFGATYATHRASIEENLAHSGARLR
jgi:hypothetical protein